MNAPDKNKHAVALGKLGGVKGGRVKSDRKSAASRENGKRGGRPRKQNQNDTSI